MTPPRTPPAVAGLPVGWRWLADGHARDAGAARAILDALGGGDPGGGDPGGGDPAGDDLAAILGGLDGEARACRLCADMLERSLAPLAPALAALARDPSDRNRLAVYGLLGIVPDLGGDGERPR